MVTHPGEAGQLKQYSLLQPLLQQGNDAAANIGYILLLKESCALIFHCFI